MATVHVTTAEQFLTAVAVADNIIEIDNDLDFNAVTTYPAMYCAEINGNGHSFYNMQCNNRKTILAFNNACNITNLAFKNTLQTDFGSFIWGSNKGRVVVSKCTFSGYYGLLASGNVTFDKCGVNAQRFLGRVVEDSGDHKPSLNECYIHADLYGSISDGMVIGWSGVPLQIDNCYFSGLVASVPNNAILFSITGTSKNNVFNIDVTAGDVVSIRYVHRGSADVANISLCNSDKIGSNISVTYGNVTPLTDAQLKNPADVRATGFPLIG